MKVEVTNPSKTSINNYQSTEHQISGDINFEKLADIMHFVLKQEYEFKADNKPVNQLKNSVVWVVIPSTLERTTFRCKISPPSLGSKTTPSQIINRSRPSLPPPSAGILVFGLEDGRCIVACRPVVN
jgi:hypothetical protein